MKNRAQGLPVAGIGALSTLDYPGHLALTVFTRGCPWRCAYCHNAALRKGAGAGDGGWKKVRAMLAERRGFLEAVVFSGGEPTLHSGLAGALRETRALGYRNGLHTAGMVPERLERVLPLLDWIGLDVKAPLDDRYARLTGDPEAAAQVRASLSLLRGRGLPTQLRTTVADTPEGTRMYEDVCLQLAEAGFARPVRQPLRRVIPSPLEEECT